MEGVIVGPIHFLGLNTFSPHLHVLFFSKNGGSLAFCLWPLFLVIPDAGNLLLCQHVPVSASFIGARLPSAPRKTCWLQVGAYSLPPREGSTVLCRHPVSHSHCLLLSTLFPVKYKQWCKQDKLGCGGVPRKVSGSGVCSCLWALGGWPQEQERE